MIHIALAYCYIIESLFNIIKYKITCGVCMSVCVCASVCAHGFWRPKISQTVEYRESVPMGHQQEMSYGESNGNVVDDVT